MTVLDRFLEYVKYDTQSDEDSSTSPSTYKQNALLDVLERQLKELGVEVKRTQFGYVFATIKANVKNAPSLAFIAHVDTAPACSGANVKPQIINYKGGDVVLNSEKGIVFGSISFPEITDYLGQDIVFTDGTTLLGADDKAGVAEIMSMAEYFVTHPEIPHCEIKIAFTYDEEVGRGAEHFDVKELNADYGYTVDGGKIGEISYENFNAAGATVRISGLSVHPGDAYGKMINAIDVFNQFHSMLPVSKRPNTTKDHQGFYMVDSVSGDVENLCAKYIIRDHDLDVFAQMKSFMLECADKVNASLGGKIIDVEINDSYFNMKQVIESKNMHLVEAAKSAFDEVGVAAQILPIRGGTDGAHLSFEGLPCPNISTGGHNFHGRFEYIPVPSLFKMVDVLVDIAGSYAFYKKCK